MGARNRTMNLKSHADEPEESKGLLADVSGSNGDEAAIEKPVIEDEHQQEQHNTCLLTVLVISSTLSSLVFGLVLAATNTCLNFIQLAFQTCGSAPGSPPWPSENFVWGWQCTEKRLLPQVALAATILGAGLGSIVGGRFTDWRGRRGALLWLNAGAIVPFVGCGLAPNWTCFIIARFFSGVAFGALSVIPPMFIGEICPDALRGHYCVYHNILICIGIVIAQALGLVQTQAIDFGSRSMITNGVSRSLNAVTWLDLNWWRFIVSCAAIPSLISALLWSTVLKKYESPIWLVQTACSAAPSSEGLQGRSSTSPDKRQKNLERAKEIMYELRKPKNEISAAQEKVLQKRIEEEVQRLYDEARGFTTSNEKDNRTSSHSDSSTSASTRSIKPKQEQQTRVVGEHHQGDEVEEPLLGKPRAVGEKPHEAHQQEEPSSAKNKTVRASSFCQNISSREHRIGIVIGCVLMVVQQISGINVVIIQSNTLLEQLAPRYATHLTVGVGVVNLLLTFAVIPMIERLGRRKLLLGSAIGCFVAMAVSLVAVLLDEESSTSTGSTPGTGNVKISTYLVPGMILLFIMSFAVGLGAVAWVYLSEIYPGKIKGSCFALATATNWIFNAIVNFGIGLVLHNRILTYAILTGLNVLGVVFVANYIVETKDTDVEHSPIYALSASGYYFGSCCASRGSGAKKSTTTKKKESCRTGSRKEKTSVILINQD